MAVEQEKIGERPTSEAIESPEKFDNQNNEIAIFNEIDPAEEKALVRKLDRVIMPLMAAVYFFQCELVFISVLICPRQAGC